MSPVDPTSATSITPEWAKQALPGAPGLDPATAAPTATKFVGDPEAVYRRLERLNTAPLRDIVREAKLLQDLNLFDEREATLLYSLAEKRGKELMGELQALDGVTTALEFEFGVYPVAPWYAVRAGRAFINYGASAGHPAARISVMHELDVGALETEASAGEVQFPRRWRSIQPVFFKRSSRASAMICSSAVSRPRRRCAS